MSLLVTVLNSIKIEDNLQTRWRFVPKYLQNLFELAEKYIANPEILQVIYNTFAQLQPHLDIGSSVWGWPPQRLEWEQLWTTCCNILGDCQYNDVIPLFDEILKNPNYRELCHCIIIDNLAKIGTEEAMESVCTVFPRREPNGYFRPRHDLFCLKATEAVIRVGTPYATEVFVEQVAQAINQIERSDHGWYLDVADTLQKPMPHHVQRNLIIAILTKRLSDETRRTLLYSLRKDSQTLHLLETLLTPGQLGYEMGVERLKNLRKRL